MTKTSRIILLFLSLLTGIQLFSQQNHQISNHESNEANHEALPSQGVAIFTGYGLIQGAIDENGNSKPKIIPVFGFDYFYFFNHSVGLAWQNDIELASYSIEEDHQNYIKRNFAILTSLVFMYEPVHNLAFFAGPGYEIEAHHDFPVFRIGAEYGLRFEDGWAAGVKTAYDFKEINSTLSFGLTVSKRFGE